MRWSCGNNGSAFFFCVHRRAECAMAEILVSDLCERRPPLCHRRVFHCRGALFRVRFPVSAPVTRLFGARAFSFAISMTFPVFAAPNALKITCIFFNGIFHEREEG